MLDFKAANLLLNSLVNNLYTMIVSFMTFVQDKIKLL